MNKHNNNNKIFDLLDKLPTDIINYVIKEFMPNKTFVFTNKTNYALYHYSIKPSIASYEHYVRDTICRDNYFVFEQILRDNCEKWVINAEYNYKNMTFTKYIFFLSYFCIENDAYKCKTIINNFFQEVGLNKNQPKKNFSKYNIKWRN